MCRFIVLLYVLVLTSPAFAGEFISNRDLGTLDKHALNKTYRRDSNLTRLERLENLAFGATQAGDLQHRYRNVENAILSRPPYRTKNSMLGTLANYFLGQTTGFTPAINENNFMPAMNLPAGLGPTNYGGNFYPAPGINNQRFEHYSNGLFGGGWGMSNGSFGNGSSIRMLD